MTAWLLDESVVSSTEPCGGWNLVEHSGLRNARVINVVMRTFMGKIINQLKVDWDDSD